MYGCTDFGVFSSLHKFGSMVVGQVKSVNRNKITLQNLASIIFSKRKTFSFKIQSQQNTTDVISNHSFQQACNTNNELLTIKKKQKTFTSHFTIKISLTQLLNFRFLFLYLFSLLKTNKNSANIYRHTHTVLKFH